MANLSRKSGNALILMVFLCVFCVDKSGFVSGAFIEIQLPPPATGPESIAFQSPAGPVFFTGVSDGRVLQYQGPSMGGWRLVYGLTSPQWSMQLCEGATDPDKGPVCGRPMGMAYDPSTRLLYVADAYFGLVSISPQGSLGTQIANSSEGQPFVATNGLDIDPRTGTVYFTDASSVYDLRNASKAADANDATGRLMKYDPQTKQVTVLMRNLGGAVGVAVSATGSFVLVSEFIANRTQKYWLRGPNANTSEVFTSSILRPNNIKRTLSGQFLIAGAVQRAQTLEPVYVRIDESGRIWQTIGLGEQYGNTLVSEVQEYGINRYVSCRFKNFVGIYAP